MAEYMRKILSNELAQERTGQHVQTSSQIADDI
jgi:hypothetical protein